MASVQQANTTGTVNASGRVAKAFCKAYYLRLFENPKELISFYGDDSTYTREGKQTTGEEKINERFAAQGFTSFSTQVEKFNFQPMLGNLVLVSVVGNQKNCSDSDQSGILTRFCQTVVLAPATNGSYYIQNDILFVLASLPIFKAETKVEKKGCCS